MHMHSSGLDKSLGLGLLLIVFTASFLSVSYQMVQGNGSDGAAETNDWPMFRHDPQHSGYSTSTAPNTDQLLWQCTIGGTVVSSPVVADGKVYVGSTDYKVYCLDAATGTFIWSYTTGDDVDSSPAVANGKLYVGSDDNKVYCLNAADGAFIWSYTTDDDVDSSPAVVDGKVYVGSGDNKVYCLSAETGVHIWNYTTGDSVHSSPAVVDGKVYLGSDDNKIYCLNAADGALSWNYTTGEIVRSSPTVANGKIYIFSDDGKVYCLNAANGTHIWNYTVSSWWYPSGPSPAVVDGKVYLGYRSANICCLDAATGSQIWIHEETYHYPNEASDPAVADGKVYVGGAWWFNCANATDGTWIWGDEIGFDTHSSPVVAYGKVYVHGYNHGLYCYGLPCICDFDGLFKLNNARMIYPSDQTPKPLGCPPAMVSDWTASAFISTKLETLVEGTDTDSAFVNQVTGKPVGAERTGIVSFGGPVVNPVVAYAESASTPIGDRAPLKFYADAGTFYFQHKNGTGITGASLPSSVINNNEDMFVIESYRDGDGRYMLLCYGFGWKGTYAAGKYFDTEIYPNLASCNYTWTVVKWEDANGNGFVNTAADGDTYTIIATGQ